MPIHVTSIVVAEWLVKTFEAFVHQPTTANDTHPVVNATRQ